MTYIMHNARIVIQENIHLHKALKNCLKLH